MATVLDQQIDKLQHQVYECREQYPQVSEQLQQILNKIKEEAAQYSYELYVPILASLQQKMVRIEEAMRIHRQINDLRNDCAGHYRELAALGLVLPQQANWGQPVGTHHMIHNVSRTIIDNPIVQQAAQGHDFIDYRVILRCEMPSRTYDSTGVFFMVRRRFNDFKALSDALSQVGQKVPELPPQKHFYFGGKSPFFIEDRRFRLQKWLQAVSSIPSIVRQQCFQEFCLAGAEWRFIEQGLD